MPSLAMLPEPRHRTLRRALLDNAGAMGCPVQVALLARPEGSLRYLLALPVPDSADLCRYYTVQDLEASEAAGRVVYRRINLDTVAGVTVVFAVAA